MIELKIDIFLNNYADGYSLYFPALIYSHSLESRLRIEILK